MAATAAQYTGVEEQRTDPGPDLVALPERADPLVLYWRGCSGFLGLFRYDLAVDPGDPEQWLRDRGGAGGAAAIRDRLNGFCPVSGRDALVETGGVAGLGCPYPSGSWRSRGGCHADWVCRDHPGDPGGAVIGGVQSDESGDCRRCPVGRYRLRPAEHRQ